MKRNETILIATWILCVAACFITGHDSAALLILFLPLVIAFIS